MYFSALILEKATVGEDPAPLFCENVVIFEAGSIEDARMAAQEYGETQAHSYVNEDGQQVSWSLERVVDVQEILDQPIKHGRIQPVNATPNVSASFSAGFMKPIV
jgi:hypothetical protein